MPSADRDRKSAASLTTDVSSWAVGRDDILALALVGSHARGAAREDSDVDFVVLSSDPARYLKNTDWVSTFGEVTRLSLEDNGKVQSVRVFYRNGLEVEFGLAGLDWTAIPPDAGTAEVLRAGCVVLLDREGLLERMLRSALGSH